MSATNDPTSVRKTLAATVESWTGSILVVDGELSDELQRHRYAALGKALENHATGRVFDDDSVAGFPATALRWLKNRLDGKHHITLAGAWFDEDSGCVVAVANGLRQQGFSIQYGLNMVMNFSESPIPREVLGPLQSKETPRKRFAPG